MGLSERAKENKRCRNAERMREKRAERKSSGKCTECGQPADNGTRCHKCSDVLNEAVAAMHKRRRDSGQCIMCGEPAEANGPRRRDCMNKDAVTQKKSQAKKLAAGLCKMCGSQPIEQSVYCAACYGKALAASKKHRSWCRKHGLCFACGEKSDGNLRCVVCSLRASTGTAMWKRAMKTAGLCRNCGQDEPVTDTATGEKLSFLCPLCYMKQLSKSMLDDPAKYQVLLDKLYRHDWRCYYTGIKLVMGRNLSFDHMNPRSRFPDQRFDPNNLVPVDYGVNLRKRDLAAEEFYEQSRQVCETLAARAAEQS